MKQIDVMKQALEALKRLKAYGNVFRFRQDEQNPYDQACEAIAILRTAIEQAERQQALDKKAENARELGLDYEPVQAEKQQPFGYLWPTGRHPEFRFTQQLRDGVEGTPVDTTPLNPLDSIKSSKTLDAQPQQAEKQEPVAWMDGYRNIYSLEEKAAGCPEATIPLVPIANQQKTSGSPIFSELHCICGAEWEWHNHDWELVTTPQPQQAEKQEPFGWVSQHTVKGPYEWQFNKELSGVYRDNAISILPVYTIPQPQREWVGLTDEEIKKFWRDATVKPCYTSELINNFARAIEAKLKEKNT